MAEGSVFLPEEGCLTRRILLPIAAVIGSGTLASCNEGWTGFVHPQRGNILTVVEIGTFGSLEECREAARAALANAGWSEGDYACGQGCRERAGVYGPFTCARTKT